MHRLPERNSCSEKSLKYPPYTKLLNITFSGPQQEAERIMDLVRISDPEIEVLVLP